MKYTKRYVIVLFTAVFISPLIGAQSPGGVGNNLSLWLKANAGVNCGTNNCSITLWSNQQGNTAWNANGTGAAVWTNDITNSINFNPTVLFTDDAKPFTSSAITRPFGVGSTIFFVCKINVINDKSFVEFRSGGSRAFFIDRRYASNTTYTTAMRTGLPNVWAVTDTGGSGFSEIFENTRSIAALNTKTFSTNWTSGNYVLGDDDTGGNQLTGTISEILYFDRVLNPIDLSKVNSYLAIKYGVSLNDGVGRDYVASNWDGTVGTRYWNATVNTGYNKDIFGIGRDDNSALNQRVSRSANADDILTISLDNDFVSNTQSPTRTTSLDNLDFFMVGNNNGNYQVSTNVITTASPNLRRINRIWSTQDTGNVGCIYYQFNTAGFTTAPGEAWYVVIADNPAFTTNVRYRQVVTGGNVVFRADMRNNGQPNYITLARLDRNELNDNFNEGLVGINTDTPIANSYLDVRGGNQGMVVSRLSQTQIDALTPVEGMIVYNTTTNTMQVYPNTGPWRNLGDVNILRFCE
ncbi:MAG: hypothetical protein NWQ09_07785 [Nonlabens sp.]|nr:hypothetical protein [Nonlabens sp.]